MCEANQFKEETLNELGDLNMNLGKEECCVCINIFTRCGENKSLKKEQEYCKDKKKKEGCRVYINIITE